MTNRSETNLSEIEVKGILSADQITFENIDDFAASLNGVIENGILVFEIHDWKHRVIPGDWVVLFTSGDLLTFTDAFFNRNFRLTDDES